MKLNNNLFISHLIIIVAIFILAIFTRGYYYDLQEQSDIKSSVENDLTALKDDIKRLEDIKAQIETNSIEDLDKYLSDFREDDLVDYFYSYGDREDTGIEIESVTLNK